MIIQIFLGIALATTAVYALSQWRRSRWTSATLAIVSVGGIYFVFVPERTTEMAHLMGVGRGADLLFYCWIVICLSVCISLQVQILNLREVTTELARELALKDARMPARLPDEAGDADRSPSS